MKKLLIIISGAIIALFSLNHYSLSNASDTLAGKTMPKSNSNTSLATFAGGCFWCMEAPYEYQEGVISVLSGYAGGASNTANYQAVSSGRTEHLEVVQVEFDPSVVTYETLLDIFWRQIDPTDAGGSFVDRGEHYASAIFYHNTEQQTKAQASKKALGESGIFDQPIATEIREYDAFYPAEDYHQDYYKENSLRYKLYRSGSGRDQFIERNWKGKENIDLTPTTSSKSAPEKVESMTNKTMNTKPWTDFVKPSDKELKASLNKMQYKVTQKDGTERAFTGPYVENKEDGIYVDILSGEPLFSSTHKYKSGTGWPSFYDVIDADTIVTKADNKLWAKRTELRSKYGDSHLGHVFPDGPKPTGQRYCINGAALKFIAKEDMQQLGYGDYLSLFK